ncbi:hypothetical protein ACWKWU_14000 [Chitinophaga lutea]
MSVQRFNRRDFLGMTSGLLALPGAVASATPAAMPGPAAPLQIGRDRQLFVDDYIIGRMEGGAVRKMHRPQPQEISILHDAPWEGSYCNNHSVFRDGDKYRMYYAAVHYIVTPGKVIDDSHEFYLCYAESDDGIHWRKPALGLHEFRGSKDNNIILKCGVTGGVNIDASSSAMFLDENPDAAPDAKYKAIIRDYTAMGGVVRGAHAFRSPDGIHWTPMSKTPVLSKGDFDSMNLAFWDARRKEYRAYWRSKNADHVRLISTARSKDFVHWTDVKELRYVDSPLEELYQNCVKAYYRAPQLIIGFPTRYIERPWSASMRALPEPEHRKMRSSAVERFGTAITEGLLMVSRDGETFKRWNEAFLRPGIEREGTWDYGQQFIGWHIVETKSALPGAPDDMSLYATESCWTGDSNALRRYTLRPDGFHSIYAPMSGGTLLTQPMVFDGQSLRLNFSSSAAGELRVAMLDAAGNPLPGFSEADCEPVYGDALDRPVTWRSGTDVAALAGKTVRLRFHLKDADLFAFNFQ